MNEYLDEREKPTEVHNQWSERAEVKCGWVLAVVLLHLNRNCSDADIALGCVSLHVLLGPIVGLMFFVVACVLIPVAVLT